MRSGTPRMALSGLLLCMLCAAGPAEGATELEPADEGESPAYRKAIKDGVTEYEAHRFEEARSLFRRAHQISPNARTFRGMGMAAFELRDYVAVMRNLSAALRDSRKPLSDEQQRHAQELLDRSSLFVDVYTVKVTPRNARVIVDGHAPELEHDGSLLFAFGRHSIEISAAGMELQTIVVDVRGGERKNFNVVLKRSVPEVQEERKREPLAIAEKAPPSSHSSGHARLLLWSGIGAGILAGGAGVYWWKENLELRECRHPAEGRHCTNEDAIRTWRNIAMGTTLGAGAAAASLALWGLLSWESGSSPSAVIWPTLVRCVPGPYALTCLGRF